VVSNYEARLERLEQAVVVATSEWPVLAYLTDGDDRPADTLELNGQTFVREPNETLGALMRRAKAATGLAVDREIRIIHYVDSNGQGGPKFSDDDYKAAGCE
jgi:hypothetical protein